MKPSKKNFAPSNKNRNSSVLIHDKFSRFFFIQRNYIPVIFPILFFDLMILHVRN